MQHEKSSNGLTRYQVSFEDRLIEPSEHGRWCKYEDFASLKGNLVEEAAQAAEQAIASQREELDERTREAKHLAAQVESLDQKLASVTSQSSAIIASLERRVESARTRLELHGHTPNCNSRYSRVDVSGTELVGDCNCGLDEWMQECGIG